MILPARKSQKHENAISTYAQLSTHHHHGNRTNRPHSMPRLSQQNFVYKSGPTHHDCSLQGSLACKLRVTDPSPSREAISKSQALDNTTRQKSNSTLRKADSRRRTDLDNDFTKARVREQKIKCITMLHLHGTASDRAHDAHRPFGRGGRVKEKRSAVTDDTFSKHRQVSNQRRVLIYLCPA